MQWMSSINGTQAASGGRDGLMGPPAGPPLRGWAHVMRCLPRALGTQPRITSHYSRSCRRRSHVVAAAVVTPPVVVAHDDDEFLCAAGTACVACGGHPRVAGHGPAHRWGTDARQAARREARSGTVLHTAGYGHTGSVSEVVQGCACAACGARRGTGRARTRWACMVRIRRQMWPVGLGARHAWREVGRGAGRASTALGAGSGERRWVHGMRCVRLRAWREVQGRGVEQAWASCVAVGLYVAHAVRSQRRVARSLRGARRQYDGMCSGAVVQQVVHTRHEVWGAAQRRAGGGRGTVWRVRVCAASDMAA
ncbi:hypothetical protein GGX14DRAFT_392379 [Mycena pura]|uniref:Uncharacterized protein n=1 Tax=Mycena pura TaxID=153505 RepID=A0AAD6YCX4_9AGAR|nr:hypothetical protein GGX14DRAFT_392379 [Mycena pura]